MTMNRQAAAPKNTSIHNDGSRAMHPVAQLLGEARHIPVNTDLVDIFGLSAAYLLQQFWYWSERTDPSRNGWFYKGRDEITEEMKLSRKEQETARRRLVEAGVLAEERRGLPARLWYRLDFDRLNDILLGYWASHARLVPPAPPETPAASAGTKGTNKMARKLPTGRTETVHLAGTKVAGSMARKWPALPTGDDTEEDRQEMTATTDSERARDFAGTVCKPEAGLFAAAVSAKAVDSEATGDRTISAEELPFPGDRGDEAGEAEASKLQKPETALAGRLAEAGVNRADAIRLARENPQECERQLTFLPFVAAFRSSRGAYLRAAVEQGFAPPPAWVEAERKRLRREKQAAIAAAKANAGGAPPGSVTESGTKPDRDAVIARRERLAAGEPALWARIEAEAEARLPPPIRQRPDGPAYRPALDAQIDALLATQFGAG